MRTSQKGFTLIELLVALSIMAIASYAAGTAIYQILRNTGHNTDHLTAVRQVENAGYWISRDIQMSSGTSVTANLTFPNFLDTTWTTWDATDPTDLKPVYNTATYYFENLINGTGTLKRNLVTSQGTNVTAYIAQYIYYSPSDILYTSNSSWENFVVKVKLTAQVGATRECREYEAKQRQSY